ENVYVGRPAGPWLIAPRHDAFEAWDASGGHEVNDATAKAAAHHPRAVNAFDPARQLDQQIKFVATDLIVVAQTAMRFAHQPPEGGEVVSFERRRRIHHARVLADYMAAAAINQFGQLAAV